MVAQQGCLLKDMLDVEAPGHALGGEQVLQDADDELVNVQRLHSRPGER